MCVTSTQRIENSRLIPCIVHSDWDLMLVSADGVTFNVHRKNLSVHSAIFADANAISNLATVCAEPEVVTLSETADVLGLLVEFMSYRPQPQLDDTPFTTIADLAKDNAAPQTGIEYAKNP